MNVNISQLTARFGGRIEKLFINYTGQNVKKGQKLGDNLFTRINNRTKRTI